MKQHKLYILRGAIVGAALVVWFWTQALIGSRALPEGGIADQVHNATTGLNAYFAAHPRFTDAVLIFSSFLIDCIGVFLLAWGIFGPSLRPVLGLLIIFALRQICQALTALPAPPGTLWHDPGVPSLLVTYGVSTDLFFSGHTAIAVFGATELWRLGKPWVRILGVAVAVFEIIMVLVFRNHYTMDVFTGAVVALLVASFIDSWSVKLDKRLVRGNA